MVTVVEKSGTTSSIPVSYANYICFATIPGRASGFHGTPVLKLGTLALSPTVVHKKISPVVRVIKI